MQVESSIALVTGAHQGIGRTFTQELLRRGAAKVCGGVRDLNMDVAPGVTPVRIDVTNPDRVAAIARELDDVTLVVNNAGVSSSGSPLQASINAARIEIETNYLSLISMTQAFAPVLARNGGGAFINVSSAFAWVAMPFLSTYTASKAAAWNFTNSVRVELKSQGTEVVGVHSGFVDTSLTAPLPVEKIAPIVLVKAALDALEARQPEVLVDEVARTVKAGLVDDQHNLYPQVEREFQALVRAFTS